MGYEGVLGFDCASNGPTNGRIIQCSGFQLPTPSYVENNALDKKQPVNSV